MTDLSRKENGFTGETLKDRWTNDRAYKIISGALRSPTLPIGRKNKLLRVPVFWVGVLLALPVAVLLALIEDLIEHSIDRVSSVPSLLIFNVVFFVLTLGFGAWWVTAQFEKARRADDSILYQFGRVLSDLRTLTEVATQIVRFFHQVAPNAVITMKVFNDKTLGLETEAICTAQGQVYLKPDLMVQEAAPGTQIAATRLYEVSFARQHQQVGCIELVCPASHPLLPEQLRICTQAETLCALAIENVLLEKVAADQAHEGYRVRQQLAQNLHDTLAQNISFLKMKIDELALRLSVRPESALQEFPVQLNQMRSTAEEAYQQVRNTIDDLNPMPSGDLRQALLRQAKVVSERGGFALRTTQIGAPFVLPSATSQHILYIVREALHNIEKHAKATHVIVQLVWLDQQMILKVVDNGIGFDPQKAQSDGHYGLWIMQHRAAEVGGRLKFGSGEDGCGAEVTLWVPRSVGV